MITVFDLRENQDEALYKSIEAFYDKPIKIIKMNTTSIKACIGCWNCWLKTPGKCVFKDQMSDSYPNYMGSDTVVLLMGTAKGFIDHLSKAFLDRTIPHYHPYIELVNGECHHVARYESYPDLVFYFEKDELIPIEEEIITDYLYRTAHHYKSKGYRMVLDNSISIYSLENRKEKRGRVEVQSTSPMEKLVIYNGSPRITKSNSGIVLKQVLETMEDHIEVRDLKDLGKWDLWAKQFELDQHVMIFMPLYVHAMPSHVMGFIEKLSPSEGTMSFFVQSGFPESSQSYYLEAYLEQLALTLGRAYLGTAIKGGFEGLQMRPSNGQEAMVRPLVNLIRHLIDSGNFDSGQISSLARPVKLNKGTQILFRLLTKIGLPNNLIWDPILKENKAYGQSFDQPYKKTI